MRTGLLILLLFIGLVASCTKSEPTVSCSDFVAALEPVPHTSLVVNQGEYVSVLDGSEHRGCEVVFETNDSLRSGIAIPNFRPIDTSEMYGRGWRFVEGTGADGPGTGTFAIKVDSKQCVISWMQPSYVDDAGQIVQAEDFRMNIQCRDVSD
ncbi:MAG: hypothetical protein HKN13_11810 [Rhodothermales bacterium]|nr:hypothetical protein [Rhodothermales bacterium]